MSHKTPLSSQAKSGSFLGRSRSLACIDNQPHTPLIVRRLLASLYTLATLVLITKGEILYSLAAFASFKVVQAAVGI